MQLEHEILRTLEKALDKLAGGFDQLPDVQQTQDRDKVEEVILEVAEIMQDNYPYFHPLYAGQMLKPPHPVAQAAYMLSLWINPNNHALDGGRASSRLEKEAVSEIARLFRWDNFLGHLTGGGTVANMEALWIAGRIHPGRKIVASDQAHYTHQRVCEVLGLKFQTVPCDNSGRINIADLVKILDKGNVGTVVATMGTTGTGSVDPLARILELKERYNFRVHADAAYGGYFTLADNLHAGTKAGFNRLAEADSIVIDPHKHGLQPYGCGCVLFKDPGVGKFYKHDSPYTYFSSQQLHLGEISLECSRPGAAAVALWATHRLLPLVPRGEFAAGLSQSRQAALAFYQKIAAEERFRTIFAPELDIVVWAPRAGSASETSRLSGELFRAAAEKNLHFALFKYPSALLKDAWQEFSPDQPFVTCLRSCLMKPQHLKWLERIWQILIEATDKVMGLDNP